MIMKTKNVSERSVVMNVQNEVKENIAVETEKMNKTDKPLSPDLLRKMNAYWRAANYLSVGQIYLYDNPLLKRPLTLADVKHMLLGHWGTTPGQNFIYVHLNRIIKKYDLDMIYVSGPGHGGPAVVGNTYLEGTYSEIYPDISQDEAGLRKLFIQFSFPGGIPSHASPECPGSIHEGGELGYSLSHSFGAVFDNPNLVVACVVGDGEAETGPLATAWQSNKFLNPITDGAVLPILHLNGYKISNPTVLARIEHVELEQFLRGCGWTPYFVEGDDPEDMHQLMAAILENAIEEIRQIQSNARNKNDHTRPRWPMIVLNSPKGWTGPKVVHGLQIEGTFRAHQVPLSDPATHPEHLKLLEDWLRSYRPEELFDEQGRLKPELAELAPRGERRMGANPHANGGMLLRDLRMPDFRDYAEAVPTPGIRGIGDTHVLGPFLRDVAKLNSEQRNFRVFGPDETLSNGLEALFEVTKRQWDARTVPNDEFLEPAGRVMEMLSEHQCEGWLEGYLLTGRHGLFNCYEAFIHIVDSMFNQHAKWLKVTSHLPWRRKIASLNYLLASHVWRQDHNGFTHQDPGFIDHVVNKKAEVVRVYLPPDANCLLSVMDHCLRSRHYVNVVIAGKHPAPQWLSMDAAVKHCAEGIGIWQWAGNDQSVAPDVVMVCCGDVPTLETLAAVSIMREHLPDLKIRVVNVVDLMKLQPQTEHPHGLSDMDFDELFTKNKPVIFAFHAYPWLIHRLTYRRTNHDNFHVRGYKEEGTITTPFDMTVLNDLDRFHLVMDTIDRLPQTGDKGIYLKQQLKDKLVEHKQYIHKHGQDMPEIRNWKWGNPQMTTSILQPTKPAA
jgi:xylulose-5-phosphate/fructose-6-phosphate phosphoketolase